MRRTSTCAWRLRPRVSCPCVASRRLSCATTRWTAARSWSGPEGSARSSSFSGRDGGSACVRSICARSSSRRRCCSKRRIWSRVSGAGGGSPSGSRTRPAGLGAQPQRAPDALDVDAEHPRALAAAPEGGDREPGEVAHGRLVAVADRLDELLAQVVVVDLLAAGDAVAVLVLRAGPGGPLAHAALHRGRLGGAEEEALEHEVEHAPVLRRLGERRRQRLAERRLLGPAHLAERARRRRAAPRCRSRGPPPAAPPRTRRPRPASVTARRRPAGRRRARRPCRGRCGA